MSNTTTCKLCGAGAAIDPDPPLIALWINGKGWLADACGEAIIKPRLRDARWFNNSDEVEAVIAELDLSKDEYTEVTL